MTDLICRKSLTRCQTPGMCSPHGGCQTPEVEPAFRAVLAERNSLAFLLKRFVDGEHDQDENQAERHIYHDEAQTLLAFLAGDLQGHTLVPDAALRAQRDQIEKLTADEQEAGDLCDRLTDLLRSTAVEVRGLEDPLKRHGFTDLPSRVKTVVAERDQLKAFAVEMINAAFEGGSFDGGDIQDIAVKHGLLRIEKREDECGERCACREYGFPAQCYRKTELLVVECGAVDGTGAVDYDYRKDLAAYFGLSYASWLTLPRVLMEAMPKAWARQMAALLHQYDDAFRKQPNYGTTVRLTVDGKLVKTPSWLSNYRHPDLAMINQLRGEVPMPSSEGSADAH